MSALKLFISHSSRLDDVEHRYTTEDDNWRLLKATCDAIRDHYGDSIELLVDKGGKIRPGSEWNQELNLWLAECHVAIILFSKRALSISDWVKKEAAILGWRAARNRDFILIPVTLAGESTPEDLAAGYFGALEIDRTQCIRNVDKAEQILAGVIQVLGPPDALAAKCAETPLDILQGAIAELLQSHGTKRSLAKALKAVGGSASPDGRPEKERIADALARSFLKASHEDVRASFKAFRTGIAALSSGLKLERANAETLFKSVRSLWVHPGAASYFTLALEKRNPLALAGEFQVQEDILLRTQAYTLERYLERAWPVSRPYVIVTVRGPTTIEKVKGEIRRLILGGALPPSIKAEEQDEFVSDDERAIVLVVAARADRGGLPHPALRRELEGLISLYKRILLVFAVEPDVSILPDELDAVAPALEPGTEHAAFLAERSTKTRLDDLFPRST